MDRISPKIDEALKSSGITYEGFRTALVESRLRGARERWIGLRDLVANLDNDELVEAYRTRFNDILATMEGRPGMDDLLKQDADAMLSNALLSDGNLNSLREFLFENFDKAADRVVTLEPALQPFGGFDQMIRKPGFARALMAYKELAESAIAENHASNDGFFSTALGPLDTYYPLIPATHEDRAKFIAFKGKAYRKPLNAANRFATGLSDDYDTSLDALRDRIGKAIRANNRAAMLQTLQDAGFIQPVSDDNVVGEITIKGLDGKPKEVAVMEIGGIFYSAVAEVISDPVMVVSEGEATRLRSQRVLVPEWLWKELSELLKNQNIDQVPVISTRLMALFNRSSLVGAFDATFHATNLLGVLMFRTPFAGTDLFSKTVGNTSITKPFMILWNVLTQDVSSDEAMKKMWHMAKLGLVPSRYGSETYSKKYAKASNAEYVPWWHFKLGPSLYGPKGLDIKARVLMYDIAKSINPDLTDKELIEFIRAFGAYHRQLEGKIERFLKHHGFAPFYTAGSTMYRNGLEALVGGGAMPKAAPWKWKPAETVLPRDKALRLYRWLMYSALGAIATWYLMHKWIRGKFPHEDPTSQLGKVAVPKALANSATGRALWGTGPGEAYIDVMGFTNPLASRGLRAAGLMGAYNTWIAGGNGNQMFEAAWKDSLNSVLHPVTSGPIIRSTSVTAFGVEPYIQSTGDRRTLNPGLFFRPAIAKTEPGLPRAKARFVEGLLSSNNFYQDVAAGLGYGEQAQRDKDKGNPWVRLGTNLILPRLIADKRDPWKTREALRQERRAVEKLSTRVR